MPGILSFRQSGTIFVYIFFNKLYSSCSKKLVYWFYSFIFLHFLLCIFTRADISWSCAMSCGQSEVWAPQIAISLLLSGRTVLVDISFTSILVGLKCISGTLYHPLSPLGLLLGLLQKKNILHVQYILHRLKQSNFLS